MDVERPAAPEVPEPHAEPSRRQGRGRLHVYLGAAPGVGKTFVMFDDGLRLAEEGVDVVVGVVETHDPRTC